MTLIYHITSSDAALAARENGEYRAEGLAHDGFIHFSGLHQVLDVAQSYYAGQHGLVLLEADVSRLKAQLKYEAASHPVSPAAGKQPRNEDFARDKRLTYDHELKAPEPAADQSFPHLYGPLNFEAVIAIYDFEPDASGRFSLPAELNTAH